MPGEASYKPVIIFTLIVFIGFSIAYIMNPEILTGLGSKLTDSYITCDSIEVTPSNIWVGENITLKLDFLNSGVKTGTRVIQVIYDGELIQDSSLVVESHHLKIMEFTVSNKRTGQFNMQIIGLDKDFSYSVDVLSPDDSILRRPN